MTLEGSVILQAVGLHKSFRIGRDRLHVLRGAALEVRRGEFVAIMGTSGSGKSTLLHILGLLDQPDEGSVYFKDREVFSLNEPARDRIRNRQIGFVFQMYHLLAELSVTENILLPIMVDSSVWGWLGRRRVARQRVAELLSLLGLENQAKQRPATLSGGERQRTAIARALIQQPELLLADEPTGNLDSAAGKAILGHLSQLNQAGQTIIMVTHDAEVASLAQRTLHLREGKLTA